MRQNIVRPMGIVAVTEEQTACPTNPCRLFEISASIILSQYANYDKNIWMDIDLI